MFCQPQTRRARRRMRHGRDGPAERVNRPVHDHTPTFDFIISPAILRAPGGGAWTALPRPSMSRTGPNVTPASRKPARARAHGGLVSPAPRIRLRHLHGVRDIRRRREHLSRRHGLGQGVAVILPVDHQCLEQPADASSPAGKTGNTSRQRSGACRIASARAPSAKP